MDVSNQDERAPDDADKAVPINPLREPAPPKSKTPGKPHNKYPWLGNIPLITEEAIEKVSRFLDTVLKGRDVDLRSPLYGAAPRKELLGKFTAMLYPKIADYPKLLSYEQAAELKDSPLSVMATYAEREPQVRSYFIDPGGSVSDDTLALACDAVKEATGFDRFERRLRPLTPEEACARLPSNTSWGLPFSLRGVVITGVEKGPATETADYSAPLDADRVDNRPLYLALALEMMTDFDHPGWDVPCMLYWRGDLGDPEKNPIAEGVKQRVVWGYPHAVSILESMFYPVLTEALKSSPVFAAWVNLPATERQVFAILEGSSEERPAFGFDASAFDQHLSERLIKAVCSNIIAPAFQKGNEALIEKLSLYSRKCGIVTPDGVLTGRDFNRPSGSGGTNLLDCFENLVMYASCLLHRECEYSEVVELLRSSIVMGDDAVYLLPASLADIGGTYEELFGAKVNADKETLSWEYTNFCKREYLRGDSESCASAVRAFLKAVSYERLPPKEWNPYCDSVRWIMQLNGLASHPAFSDIVDFVCAGDKFALGLSVPGGPLQLFKLASRNGTVDLDQVLGLKQWSNEYTGFTTRDARNLPVMQYLLDKYRAAHG